MKKILTTIKIGYLSVILFSGVVFTSCNKDLDSFPAIATPTYPSGNTMMGRTLAAITTDSIYYAMVVKSTLLPTLNDSTKRFTLFAVDDAGMKLFINGAILAGGGTPISPTASAATYISFLNANTSIFSVTNCASIVQYNTLGLNLSSSQISTTFPNYPYTTLIQLDPVNQPFVRMPIFPVRGTPYSYVNGMPLTAVDQSVANGIIHHTFSLVRPPSLLLRQMINAEPTLSYFRAAVLRADSGQVVKGTVASPDSTNFLNYLLGYGVTNMTIMPPNDVAFQNLVYGLVYAKVFALTGNATIANAQANGAVALGPSIFTNPAFASDLSPTTVRGIIAYHFLGSNSTPINTTGTYKPDIRVFSNNIPSTPTLIKTLVNGVVASHPGVRSVATYSGPTTTSLQFTGLGTFPTGGAPFSGPAANAVKYDQLAVNGIYHIIDRVLLPQ